MGEEEREENGGGGGEGGGIKRREASLPCPLVGRIVVRVIDLLPLDL